jgi:hypothetical protein
VHLRGKNSHHLCTTMIARKVRHGPARREFQEDTPRLLTGRFISVKREVIEVAPQTYTASDVDACGTLKID